MRLNFKCTLESTCSWLHKAGECLDHMDKEIFLCLIYAKQATSVGQLNVLSHSFCLACIVIFYFTHNHFAWQYFMTKIAVQTIKFHPILDDTLWYPKVTSSYILTKGDKLYILLNETAQRAYVGLVYQCRVLLTLHGSQPIATSRLFSKPNSIYGFHFSFIILAKC